MNFIEITLRQGYSPVNLLHNFLTPFPKNISEGLLLGRRSFCYTDQLKRRFFFQKLQFDPPYNKVKQGSCFCSISECYFFTPLSSAYTQRCVRKVPFQSLLFNVDACDKFLSNSSFDIASYVDDDTLYISGPTKNYNFPAQIFPNGSEKTT